MNIYASVHETQSQPQKSKTEKQTDKSVLIFCKFQSIILLLLWSEHYYSNYILQYGRSDQETTRSTATTTTAKENYWTFFFTTRFVRVQLWSSQKRITQLAVICANHEWELLVRATSINHVILTVHGLIECTKHHLSIDWFLVTVSFQVSLCLFVFFSPLTESFFFVCVCYACSHMPLFIIFANFILINRRFVWFHNDMKHNSPSFVFCFFFCFCTKKLKWVSNVCITELFDKVLHIARTAPVEHEENN